MAISDDYICIFFFGFTLIEGLERTNDLSDSTCPYL